MTGGSYTDEVSWDLDCGEVGISGGAPYSGSIALLPNVTCVLSMQDSWGDGWNGATWSGIGQLGLTLPSGDFGSVTFVTPPPPSPLAPPAPPQTPCVVGRCVDSFHGLEDAVYGSAEEIRLAAGTYLVMSTLVISRNASITAAEGATVVLDGQNARQVMRISAGTVYLVGLSITRGNADSVRKQSLRPGRKVWAFTNVHLLFVHFVRSW